MDEIELAIPEAIVESLPADSEDAKRDMGRAVTGWQEELNAAIAGDEDEAVATAVDMIERSEKRWEAYDEFVVELRAWGQSPIYAMAWRNLHASVVRQITSHEGLADEIDRERNARMVEDGIRPG